MSRRCVRYSLALISVLLFATGAAVGLAQGSPEGTEGIVLREITVDGNTILSEVEISNFEDRFVGTKLSPAELVGALQKEYAERGYVTTLVIALPGQDVTDGGITLKVVEGRVGFVALSGNEYYHDRNYSCYLPEPGDVFNRLELENALNLVNAHPGKQVNVKLRKGQEVGTTDIDVLIEDEKPWHFSVELNNTGTKETKKLRTSLTARYDNVFDASQIAILQYTTTPEDFDQVQQWALSYYMPLGPVGAKDWLSEDSAKWLRTGLNTSYLNLYIGHSDSDTETIIEDLRLEGEGWVVGALYNFPLPDAWGLKHVLGFGLEWQRIKDTIQFGEGRFSDKVKKLPLILRWDMSRRNAKGSTHLSTGLRYQFDNVFLNFDDREYHLVRQDVETTYWVLLFGVQRIWRLDKYERFKNWKDWSFLASLDTQWTDERLLPSEQLGFGGYDSVRGYRRRTVIADKGLCLRTELRSPLLPKVLPDDWEEQAQLLMFVDYGLASNEKAEPSELDSDNLLGIGVGMRASLFDSALTARLDAGVAILDVDATNSDEAGDLIFHFGVQYSF